MKNQCLCQLWPHLTFHCSLFSAQSCSLLVKSSFDPLFTTIDATMPKPTQQKDTPPKSLLHVNFSNERDDMSDRKKKYLTAKYGQHQMNLIKKRLRVEMWMYEQLQALYNVSVSHHFFHNYSHLFFVNYLHIKRIRDG